MPKADLFDFSHLSPAERIELAEQLWDSLPVQAIQPTDAQLAEIRRRRAEMDTDGDPGEPWEKVLDEIQEYGA
jgi:putative addiction module component (TIGR02574 family)